MTYRHKVLLIEDDAFTRFMMSEIIAALGVGVESAKDGDEGCQILQDQPDDFGLVLMDLHMPILSGVDATRRIRNAADKHPRHVPIIAVTADVTYHNTARVEELGMDGYTGKPVSPGTLLSLIDRYCAA